MPGLTGLCGLSGLSSNHGGPYHEKILDYDPIVLFPLWEAAGVQADEIANGWNGVHTGVTLGQPGIGDGYTCPFYDGINDFTNIWTAAFQAAFDGAEGSLIIWAKVTNVGVWTDGANRHAFRLLVDVNNYVSCRKTPVANQLILIYIAGGVVEIGTINGVTTTDWFSMGITWSASADEVRFFLNGVQQGATAVGLGVWAGNLAATATVIGAGNTTPASTWHGWLDYGAVCRTALPPAAMAELGILVGGVL